MKLSNIFEGYHMDLVSQSLGDRYWPKTMTYPDIAHDDEDATAPERRQEDAVADLVHLPSHLGIEETDEVSVVKDNETLKSGEWKDIRSFLRKNWHNLSGTYRIVQDGRVVHTIRIA